MSEALGKVSAMLADGFKRYGYSGVAFSTLDALKLTFEDVAGIAALRGWYALRGVMGVSLYASYMHAVKAKVIGLKETKRKR